MDEGERHEDRPGKASAEIERIVQVLSLEYDTLRDEILVRLTARYQFVGFVTGAAGLIGAGIGLSSYGVKTWILVGLATSVVAAGVWGYVLMRYQNIRLSARVALLERRINDLVHAEPGYPRLLSWETDQQGMPLVVGPFSLIRKFGMLMQVVNRNAAQPSGPEHPTRLEN